ncbi:amidohydrolase [Aliamphritea hakodatensis]|uniref:amidohydrolase n=1 Tax=Aliamphritea hakodatensis TaxID=2895352 RepID=UPI0022FD425F|nr:amidohydrolase [Aliamphritea hakodatensis]
MHKTHWQKIRHRLHQHPELSGNELATARFVTSRLQQLKPDRLYTDIGGYGVAACFDSPHPGPVVLFRAELDALPINEINTFAHRSVTPGVSHKCGHDGHMTILLSLASYIADNQPERGTAIVLFQPAEETGEGARAIVGDPAFSELAPDYCFALHNLPGHPMGQVMIRSGSFNCASRGLTIELTGKTAHAAYPETGISPASAIAELIQTLPGLASNISQDERVMLTLIHCTLGEAAFGTSPGQAKLLATLRSESDSAMHRLIETVTDHCHAIAAQHSLSIGFQWDDVFAASRNDAECAEYVAQAARECGQPVKWLDEPFRWSEDFGAISAASRGAMFALGAGEKTPQIHNPDYDFPDQLITTGTDIFAAIYRQLLRET